MRRVEQPQFESEIKQDIYDYVERHGEVDIDDLYQSEIIDMRRGRYRRLLSLIEQYGYLTKEGTTLRVDMGTDSEGNVYTTDEVDFVVQSASEEDLDDIVDVIDEVAEEHGHIVAASLARRLSHEGTLLRRNEAISRMVFVATVGQEVVGWCHLESSEAAALSHTAELTLGVLAEFRNAGIGTTLMNRALEWAEESGFAKVYQSLPATNTQAIDFLKANDWVEESRRPDHFNIDDRHVDEVMLAYYPEN